MFQIPGYISRHDIIKRLLWKFQILSIHSLKTNLIRQIRRIGFRFLQHLLCIIYRRYLISLFR